MKKLSLFILTMLMIGSLVAQKAGFRNARPAEYKPVFIKEHPENETGRVPVLSMLKESKTTSGISKVLIGSSRNIYGGLLSFQTCLTYNRDLDNIMFTARGNDKGNVSVFGTGNDIVTYTSSNKGATFTRKMAFSNGSEPRYPSGVFYNPEGNTDTSNAYKLVVGPLNVNSSWDKTYMNTGKYDGTSQNLVQVSTDNTFKELMRNGLTATSDNKFHFSGLGTVLNSSQTAIMNSQLFTLTGTWNPSGNKIDWNPATDIETNVVQKPIDNSYYIDGSYSQEAWARDGSIGYLITLGSDNRPADKPCKIPMVWKSVNEGTTWTMLPYFDWGTLPAIRNNIFPTKFDTTVYRPFFEEASIVLDANNKPHIFGLVRGGWSANLDSLTYVFIRNSTGTIMDGNIVELYLDANNTWQGNWIDSISADAMTEAKSPYYSTPTNVGWDHRVSASVTDDGSKVFCTWTDSDWIFWGTEAYLFNPDLKGWGRNVFSNMATPVKNFTENSELWGLAFFNFTSRNAISNPAGGYDLPVTVTDINASGMQADEPVYHYYVQGCSFGEDDFIVGTREIDAMKATVGSACYPDPFSGTTTLDVSLINPEPVTVDIFNITGNLLSSTNYGNLASGTHKIIINGAQLKSGAYFFTVNCGEKKFSRKMIVR